MSAAVRYFSPRRTLADVLPLQGIAVDALLIVLCSVLVGLSAQVAIPLPGIPVPVTGQTFAVLLTGMLLGSRRAAIAVLLYLSEGAAGLPVFAGGAAGAAVFAGNTAGYLFAFPLAAFLTGLLAERGWDRKPLTAGLGMFLGSLIILSIGSLVLSAFVGGVGRGFALGFVPFLPGDLIKTTLAAIALPGAWRLLERNHP
ncbi:MAG TPA: biotin transporter BioY [Armatimonadaceae bacterium]|nr:biotin transporter BioY [Armatimonadaceae bacterium]